MAILKIVAYNKTEDNINYLRDIEWKLENLLDELIDANLIVDAGLVICSLTYINHFFNDIEVSNFVLENDIIEYQVKIKHSNSINEQGAYRQAIKYQRKMIAS